MVEPSSSRPDRLSDAFPQPNEKGDFTAEDVAEVRARVLAFMEDLGSKDLKRIGEWFDDESKLWVPPAAPVCGKSRILALFRMVFNRYTDLNWEVKNVYCVDGNSAIFSTTSWGMLKPDTQYQNDILTLVHFSDARKIISLSDYMKDTKIFC